MESQDLTQFPYPCQFTKVWLFDWNRVGVPLGMDPSIFSSRSLFQRYTCFYFLRLHRCFSRGKLKWWALSGKWWALPGKSHGWRSLVGCSPGIMKSWTRLSDFTFSFHFHALEKEMATHSSVLAWRIPGMGEPGGLPSLGSHRVGHDWSDLAAAAAVCESVDSVQFSRSVVSGSLRPHEPQAGQASLSITNSRSPPKPMSIESVIPSNHLILCCPLLPSCPQSFPASGSFQMSKLSASGRQSIGVSTSTSVPPVNTQDWSPLGWTGWISLQSKGLSRVFSSTTESVIIIHISLPSWASLSPSIPPSRSH